METKMDPRAAIQATARTAFRSMFRAMCIDGRWNYYRVDGTDRFVLFREDGERPEGWSLAVSNVHAMSEDQFAARLHSYLQR